jgi:hypothetical protein
MHLNLKKRASGDILFGLIYGTIALLALIAARILPVQDMMPSCAFKVFAGIPCPSCGTTRSLVHFANGDLAGSFGLNPAVALIIIGAILLFVYDVVVLFNGSRIAFSLTLRETRWIRSGTVVAFLANWIYLTIKL